MYYGCSSSERASDRERDRERGEKYRCWYPRPQFTNWCAMRDFSTFYTTTRLHIVNRIVIRTPDAEQHTLALAMQAIEQTNGTNGTYERPNRNHQINNSNEIYTHGENEWSWDEENEMKKRRKKAKKKKKKKKKISASTHCTTAYDTTPSTPHTHTLCLSVYSTTAEGKHTSPETTLYGSTDTATHEYDTYMLIGRAHKSQWHTFSPIFVSQRI